MNVLTADIFPAASKSGTWSTRAGCSLESGEPCLPKGLHLRVTLNEFGGSKAGRVIVNESVCSKAGLAGPTAFKGSAPFSARSASASQSARDRFRREAFLYFPALFHNIGANLHFSALFEDIPPGHSPGHTCINTRG